MRLLERKENGAVDNISLAAPDQRHKEIRSVQGCHEQVQDKGKQQPRNACNGTGTREKSWLTSLFSWLVGEQEKLLVLHCWSCWETVVPVLVKFFSFETTCIRFLCEKNLGFFCVLIRRHLGRWRELSLTSHLNPFKHRSNSLHTGNHTKVTRGSG